MKRYRKGQRIEIHWIDSKGITAEWEFWDGLLSVTPAKIKTSGYVTEQTGTYITVCQSTSKMQVIGRMTIPICSILKIKEG